MRRFRLRRSPTFWLACYLALLVGCYLTERLSDSFLALVLLLVVGSPIYGLGKAATPLLEPFGLTADVHAWLSYDGPNAAGYAVLFALLLAAAAAAEAGWRIRRAGRTGRPRR